MNRKDVLTRILAGIGALLVWFPILAPILLSVINLFASHWFLFDYLMPAELFPFALAGGGLLVWAALRAHSRQRLIGWSLVIAVALLAGGQALAGTTGLASGKIAPTGFWWVIVLATLVIYSMAMVALGISGVALLVDLFKTRPALVNGS